MKELLFAHNGEKLAWVIIVIALGILFALTPGHAADAVSDEEVKALYGECRARGIAPGMQSRTSPEYKPGYEGCSDIDKEYIRRDIGNLERQRMIEDQRLKAIKSLSDKIKGNAK